MAVIREIKCRNGGTVRIMDDCLPKTAQEREQRVRRMEQTCLQVLETAVAALGVEAVLERMTNGPHADLLKGRI